MFLCALPDLGLPAATVQLTEASFAVLLNDHLCLGFFLKGGVGGVAAESTKSNSPRLATVNMSNCLIHEVCRSGAASSVLTGERRITAPPVPRPLHPSGSVTLQPQVQDLRHNVPSATFAFTQR